MLSFDWCGFYFAFRLGLVLVDDFGFSVKYVCASFGYCALGVILGVFGVWISGGFWFSR